MLGMDIFDASLLPAMLIAGFAGLLSFLSPCVLPIVPPYLAYMGGVTVSEMEGRHARRRAVGSAMFFVLGLSTGGGSAFGAYVLGLAFAFGWTPCIGPILGAILSIAANEADVARGTTLLAAYAIGLGLPFLLVAAFFPNMKGLIAWMKRHMERIERVMGLLLWTVGLLMMTGKFTDLAWWLNEKFPVLQQFG